MSPLKKMRRIATALLLFVTIVYLVCRVFGDGQTWLGYVQAFAEASMVGALADWFAVTALFRHPLGLPIPHTAIVEKRKDEIGRGLGEFVQENFLVPGVLGPRLRAAEPSKRLGAWLNDVSHVSQVGDAAASGITIATSLLRDEDVQAVVEHTIRARIEATPIAPLLGRGLDIVRANGRQEQLVSAVLARLGSVLDENRVMLRGRFASESPWWVPEQIDDRVFERLFDGFVRFVEELRSNEVHPLRQTIDRQVSTFVEALQNDPVLIAKGETTKADFLDHPAVREWIGAAWGDLKTSLLAQTRDPSSELRARIDRGIKEFGNRLRTDEVLRERVDGFVERSALGLVASSGGEVANLITQTVERWDADETVERFESQIGRDLQFIRINGTIVGGLAGLAIHVIGQVLG